MSDELDAVLAAADDPAWQAAVGWAGAFIASFLRFPQTRRAYQRDLHCWFAFCTHHQLHPYTGIRRTHIELYLRGMETMDPPLANMTRYRRIATLSSWYRWLEDEDLTVGNPAARVNRPNRHRTPQPWLDRNQLTDLLTAAEDDSPDAYALVCLLGLNGLRVSEACRANLCDLAGSRYTPTLYIIGKGDKAAEIVLNPQTQQAIDQAAGGRESGPILRNQHHGRMRPHNAAAILRRLARTAKLTVHVTPHALRRSYITIGLLQGVPLRDMQRAARHTKADTTIAYDQPDRSFHRDPTFVLMSATAR